MQPCGNNTTAVLCDGPEDCQAGEQCCGTYSNQIGTYSEVECQSACQAGQLTMCHTPNDCSPGQACMPSMALGPGYGFCQ
jgi:hypothetical protein